MSVAISFSYSAPVLLWLFPYYPHRTALADASSDLFFSPFNFILNFTPTENSQEFMMNTHILFIRFPNYQHFATFTLLLLYLLWLLFFFCWTIWEYWRHSTPKFFNINLWRTRTFSYIITNDWCRNIENTEIFCT